MKALFALFFAKGVLMKTSKQIFQGFFLLFASCCHFIRDSAEVLGAGSGNEGGVRFWPLILQSVPVRDSAYLRSRGNQQSPSSLPDENGCLSLRLFLWVQGSAS